MVHFEEGVVQIQRLYEATQMTVNSAQRAWFMYQTKGINDVGVAPKMLKYIEAAEAQGSENWGDVKTGPITRFSP